MFSIGVFTTRRLICLSFLSESLSGLDEFQYGQLSRVHGSGLGENHPPRAGQEVIVLLELILDDGQEQDALHFKEAGIGAHLNITGPEGFSVPFEVDDGKIQVSIVSLGHDHYAPNAIVIDDGKAP